MTGSWTSAGIEIDCNKARLDIDLIHEFLSTSSYWAQNRSRAQTDIAIENSICFGVYLGSRQIGFARVVTDRATFAYVGDVFIINEFRGRGIGKYLLEKILAHRVLQGLRRWILATRDAHGLYRQFGFSELIHPERWMELPASDAY